MRTKWHAKPRLKHAAWALGGVVVVAVLSIGSYLGDLQFTSNFHPVIPGVLYRSAQPTADEIAEYHATFGIKTIVNLRGENRGADWYRVEVAESRRLGLTHIDFRMSASEQLTKQQAEELIGILRHAELPLLVHCQAGADRSGLVAALYVAAVAGLGEEAAEDQISIRYGHISLPISGAYAMDRSWETFEPWLGFPDS